MIRLFLVILFFVCIETYAQKNGDIVFRLDFNSDTVLDSFDVLNDCDVVTVDGISALRIKKRNTICSLRVPVDKIRGAKLLVTSRVKAKNITKKYDWNGVKIMLEVKQPGDNIYAQTPMPAGTFDWTENSFYQLVPIDADTATLVIGLENAKGKVWFDNIEIKIAEPARQRNEPPANAVKTRRPPGAVHRGIMVSTYVDANGIKTLAEWKVKHIRWQMTWDGIPSPYADTANYVQYRGWLDSTLTYFDAVILPECRKYGISVTIDLHTLPGGCVAGSYVHKIFVDKNWQKAFMDIWRDIAKRYKNEPLVYGYDIANEPVEGFSPDGLMNWHQLAGQTSRLIRDIDDKHFIIVEAAPGGTDFALAAMKPIAVSKVLYSFHMYVPAFFTHQGLGGRPSGIRYPGMVENREWNKTALQKALEPVRKWQYENDADIYVGEFSAIRWAPGESVYYYLRDCIELFEENGWDWVYHAFREYDGWSVEHNNDPNDHNMCNTEKLKLILKAFDK